MKIIVRNEDNLTEKDIEEVVVRAKALIINDDCIYIGNENSVYQFPGGHLEENETLEQCIKREILEETGIILEDREITKPFLKIENLNKNNIFTGKSRKNEIYYFAINTHKNPDMNNTNYTERELSGNFKLEKIPLEKAIKIIENNIPNNEMNKYISPDMICAIEEYLSNRGVND